MKLNHYHLELTDPSGFILLEADVPFTALEELLRTCKQWATIKNAHGLGIWRGARYQFYHKQLLDSNQHFRWEKQGPVIWRKAPFKY